MYDEESLHQLNLQAYDRFRELTDNGGRPVPSDFRMPPVFPLTELGNRLMTGPPLLSFLSNLMSSQEDLLAFRTLTREFLPLREKEIMSQPIDRRAQTFAAIFSKEYFPLHSAMFSADATVGLLVERIMFQPAGFSPDLYHRIDEISRETALAVALCETPWIFEDAMADDEQEFEEQGDHLGTPGWRIPFLELASGVAGPHLAKLIPGKGFTQDDLCALEGTKYSGLCRFYEWFGHLTENMWLDTNGYDYEMFLQGDDDWNDEEGMAPDTWTRAHVDRFANDWEEAQYIIKEAGNFTALLRERPAETLSEVLSVLLGEHVSVSPPAHQIELPITEEEKHAKKNSRRPGSRKGAAGTRKHARRTAV